MIRPGYIEPADRTKMMVGMSYEQCSRTGGELVKEAAATGNRWPLVEQLRVLRQQMKGHIAAGEFK